MAGAITKNSAIPNIYTLLLTKDIHINIIPKMTMLKSKFFIILFVFVCLLSQRYNYISLMQTFFLFIFSLFCFKFVNPDKQRDYSAAKKSPTFIKM